MKKIYEAPLMDIERFEGEAIASLVDISETNYIPDTQETDVFD